MDESVNITPNDVWAFFLPLRRYRFVDTNQFIALNTPDLSESWVRERLTQLRKAGYIAKPSQQNKMLNRIYRPRVYENTKLADAVLVEADQAHERQLTCFGSNSQHFWHSVGQAQFFISLEIELRQFPHLRLIPWWEILERAPTKSFKFKVLIDGKERFYIPDDVYGIHNTTTRNAVFCALEFDMATENTSSKNPNKATIERKYKAISHVLSRRLHETQLGLKSFVPQIVTVSERKKRSVVKHLSGMQLHGKGAICFKVLPRLNDDWTVPKPEDLKTLDNWERVVGEPYHLSKIE